MSVRCRPDLIISDESMGRVKGSQLAALLKVAFHEAAPPIIILTDGEAHQDPEAGICMLRKPVERVALLEIIEPLLVRCSQPPS
jgi:DNA-binding response OmpR family regulator